jgi:hypothetical protein
LKIAEYEKNENTMRLGNSNKDYPFDFLFNLAKENRESETSGIPISTQIAEMENETSKSAPQGDILFKKESPEFSDDLDLQRIRSSKSESETSGIAQLVFDVKDDQWDLLEESDSDEDEAEWVIVHGKSKNIPLLTVEKMALNPPDIDPTDNQ